MSSTVVYDPSDRPNPRGEIVVRWKNGLQTRYWKRPDLDAKQWRGGWFHTGDVGSLDYHHDKVVECGPKLAIIDRVSALEEIYWRGDSKWINATSIQSKVYGPGGALGGRIIGLQHCILVGDRMQHGVVAVLALNAEFIAAWDSAATNPSRARLEEDARALRSAVASGGRGGVTHRRALAAVPPAVAAYALRALRDVGNAALARGELEEWEVPIAVVCDLCLWTQEERVAEKEGRESRGVVTLTGKPKRAIVKMAYREAIMAAYAAAPDTHDDAADAPADAPAAAGAAGAAAAAAVVVGTAEACEAIPPSDADSSAFADLTERLVRTLDAIGAGEGAALLPFAVIRRGRRLAAKSVGFGDQRRWETLVSAPPSSSASASASASASSSSSSLSGDGADPNAKAPEEEGGGTCINHCDWIGSQSDTAAPGFSFTHTIDAPIESTRDGCSDERVTAPPRRAKDDEGLRYIFLANESAVIVAPDDPVAAVRRAIHAREGLDESTRVVLVWNREELLDGNLLWKWPTDVTAELTLRATVRLARPNAAPLALAPTSSACLNDALNGLRRAAFAIRTHNAAWVEEEQAAMAGALATLEAAKEAQSIGVQTVVRPVLQATIARWAGALDGFPELGPPLKQARNLLRDAATEAVASRGGLGVRVAPLVRQSSLDVRGEWTVHSPLKVGRDGSSVEFASRPPIPPLSLDSDAEDDGDQGGAGGDANDANRGSSAAAAAATTAAVTAAPPTPPSFIDALRSVILEFTRLRSDVESAQQRVRVLTSSKTPSRQRAYDKLNEKVCLLRELGDEHDVDTLGLPFCWTMDLTWLFPPENSALNRTTMECFLCHRRCYTDIYGEHMDSGCSADVGVCTADDNAAADAEKSKGGVGVGGSMSSVCAISGTTIDTEDTEIDLAPGSSDRRAARFFSLDAQINRLPKYHRLLQWLHTAVSSLAASSGIVGAQEGVELLLRYDGHRDEMWISDRAHQYWLDRHTIAGKWIGERDTPASLCARAFCAYAPRPALAIPSEALVPSSLLPRISHRRVLVDSAGAHITEHDSFLWLSYADLGEIVHRVAAALYAALPPGSFVAISGYNDYEWIIADLAVARAGMVSVGIHTTYTAEEAIAVASKVRITALLCMGNLMVRSRRIGKGAADRWVAADLTRSVPSLTMVVAMDMPLAFCAAHAGAGSSVTCASFLEWVRAGELGSASRTALPDPFAARGALYAPYVNGEEAVRGGDASGAVGEHALSTIMFTSGSAGTPKAVAVGLDSFVADIAGDSSSSFAISNSLTVSYIPLSHSRCVAVCVDIYIYM